MCGVRALGIILASVAILVVIITIANSQLEIVKVEARKSISNDNKIASVLKQFGQDIGGHPFVISANTPEVIYFTQMRPWTPYGITSQAQLVKAMHTQNYHYLLVFENQSANPELKKLFTTAGIKSLQTDFNEIKTYHSQYYTIHLYQLI